jgi:hypothetical protein
MQYMLLAYRYTVFMLLAYRYTVYVTSISIKIKSTLNPHHSKIVCVCSSSMTSPLQHLQLHDIQSYYVVQQSTTTTTTIELNRALIL